MDRLKSPSRSRSRSFSADAERRVRGFLRGFGIADEHALRELTRRLARLAPAAIAPGAGSAALEAAAGRWFASLFGLAEIDAPKALAAGRLAWLATDAARRWPVALFADAPPAVLVEQLRGSAPTLPPPELGDPMRPADVAWVRPRVPALKPARLRARTA
jgi:hypothetical protein